MKKSVFILLLILINLGPLTAHPHMKLIPRLDFDFNGKSCEGFWVEWGFDDYFSASIIFDYDRDKNGSFSEEEIQMIHDEAFINLKNYGYFVYLSKGDRKFHPEDVTDFTAWQENKKIFYKFYVSLEGLAMGDNFRVSIFDPSYFCSVEYQNPYMTFNQSQENGPDPGSTLSINKASPVYYDPFSPASDGTIYDKWGPGLQTAYPEEIHIFFD